MTASNPNDSNQTDEVYSNDTHTATANLPPSIDDEDEEDKDAENDHQGNTNSNDDAKLTQTHSKLL
eukprot:CAMPEP_0197051182 /NCGR_PEP_ID=MMETSP1384-20130603/25913_1 /TAXON_ID=29189 /ORGANISM="Ammonia sp." /LENGTH=65 /DNA_ID=CAMNT_0042483699 /DNA_START=8 /DNA_END=202 /DNA_ORIENTATION=-